MPDVPLSIAEIDERIAAIRENLTELTEQAAAYSGGAVEELTAQRIADQEAQLDLLTRQRDELTRPKSRGKKLEISVKQHMEVIRADGVTIRTSHPLETRPPKPPKPPHPPQPP